MIKIKERKCPVCGDGSLKKEVIIETFNYKRESVVIPNYVIWLCSECGEAIVDNETLKESGKILKAFIRELDGVHYQQFKEDFFNKRTFLHISKVREFLNNIISLKDPRIENTILEKEKQIHDETKFREPERTPYIALTWKYKTGREVSRKMQTKIREATFYHVIHNKHHPEYWDKNITINSINHINRNLPAKPVVATTMPLSYVACMVADWLAVSVERNTSPSIWANYNINIRWIFNNNQIELIYDLINHYDEWILNEE